MRESGRETGIGQLDHRAFVAGLSAEARAALTQTSDRKGLIHLAAHWGLLALCAALAATGAPGWPAFLIMEGVLLVFCFTLLHETLHRTPFRTVWLNEAVMRICGAALILPPLWFRQFHFAHHRHTNDPARDPELARPKPESWGAYLWAVSGVPVWRAQVRQLWVNAAGGDMGDYVPAAMRPAVQREAWALIALYAALLAALAAGWSAIFWCWIAPLVIGQPFLRLYLMAEHGRCPHVADMLANSRTTFTNAVIRRLAWNMPYHAEHHAMPTAPFHQLPALHRLARPHLKSTAPGYVAFHRAAAPVMR